MGRRERASARGALAVRHIEAYTIIPYINTPGLEHLLMFGTSMHYGVEKIKDKKRVPED